MSDASVFGLIGLTEESVGLDRRIYTGLTSTDPTLAVSYNSGRVDVFLNGVKLVGDHSEMPSGTKDYTFTATGQGSSITLATGVALVSSDVVEVMGYVSNSANTVTTYSYTASDGDTQFTANNSSGDLVNVFLNGVLLDSSDYNLTTANTVTLGSGAAASDIVHIQVIGALDNSNFVSASGGTFTGPITGVDVNGTELVLDADGDTSITADTDDQIDIKVGGTDRVQIDSSGNLELKTTSAQLKIPSGGGINYSNVADTATGETTQSSVLDDYEEGSFTITLSAGSVTTGSSVGKYIKIGKLVTVYGQFQIDSSGSSSSLSINSLPYASASAISNNTNSTVGAVRSYNGAIESNSKSVITHNPVGSSLLHFQSIRDSTSSTGLVVSADAYYSFTHTYEAA